MKCFVKDCTDAPTHAAGVRLWLRHRRGSPAEVVTSLFACGPHSLQLTPENVMTDEAWAHFAPLFHNRKGAPPDRNLTEVYTLPLDHPQVKQLIDEIAAMREHLGITDECADVLVTCAACGLVDLKVGVRVRGSNEHVTHYMRIVQAFIWRAHAAASPACRVDKLTTVKIPPAAMGWSEEECNIHIKESPQ